VKHAQSFLFFGREGRKYRVYLNTQREHWYAAFSVDGKRQRVALGARTKTEAEIAIKQFDCPPERAVEVIANAVQEVTWAAFSKKYLAYKTEQGKAPRTVERYKAALEAFGRYLEPQGLESLSGVNLAVLEGYIPYRVKEEGCGVKTAYTDALVIKNALKWGSKASRGLLTVNPASDWETKEPVLPKRRMYSAPEVQKLEKGVRPWLRPIVITLAWTGLRIGELVNLRWKDVDFKQGVLNIRIREDWAPKGRADRVVPLHPKVEAVLKKQPVGEFVFRGRRGGHLKETFTLKCLKADQVALGMPQGDLHGFRRFFATSMLQAGVQVEMVRQWGGWKSLETMLRYLADIDVKDSVKAMGRVGRRVASA